MAEMGDGARVVLIASGVMLHKSTSIMVGSQVVSPIVAEFQSGSSLKLNTKASIPTFSPPGRPPTPHIVVTSMLVTGGGSHKGSFWGLPSVRMLRCP